MFVKSQRRDVFSLPPVEQALIEIHGLGKNGGTLINRINSIAATNPIYASAVQRGYDLLKPSVTKHGNQTQTG